MHLVGGAALIVTNRSRVFAHRGTQVDTLVKSALTGAALAATAYSGWQGSKVLRAGRTDTEGGTVPAEQTPDEVAAAQQRLRIVQCVIPALTGALVVFGAQHGEQQRPSTLAADLTHRN